MPVIKYLIALLLIASPCFGATYQVTSASTTVDGDTFCSGVCQPDDILELDAGTRGAISFVDVKGTSGHPIIIRNNSSGKTTIDAAAGWVCITVYDCQYTQFRGDNAAGITYGIKLQNSTNQGFFTDRQTEDLELSYFEITAVDIGVTFKSDTDQNGNAWGWTSAGDRSWEQDNMIAHHIYVHDNGGGEGFYIGSTAYAGPAYKPLVNGEIYNCILENITYDGIQVTSAPNGFLIHDNTLTNIGTDSGGSWPTGANGRFGITMGGLTQADCYNNKIRTAYGSGINMNNNSNCDVYNNDIAHTAIAGYVSDGGIRNQWSPGTSIRNNTIADPGRYGITLIDAQTTGHVFNNIAVGSTVADIKANGLDGAELHDNQTGSISSMLFADYASGDLSLSALSPALDIAATGYPATDILGVSRPQGDGADIGAYEGSVPSTGGTVLTGLGGSNISEDQLNQDGDSGYTVTLTVSGDTWVATVGADNAITTALIAGITCTSEVQAAGFAANLAPKINHADITRTSGTVLTWAIEGDADYNIETAETWQIAIPASALTSGVATTASPNITVSAVQAATSTSTRAITSGGTRAIVSGGTVDIVTQ